jgi:hypothetical protein
VSFAISYFYIFCIKKGQNMKHAFKNQIVFLLLIVAVVQIYGMEVSNNSLFDSCILHSSDDIIAVVDPSAELEEFFIKFFSDKPLGEGEEFLQFALPFPSVSFLKEDEHSNFGLSCITSRPFHLTSSDSNTWVEAPFVIEYVQPIINVVTGAAIGINRTQKVKSNGLTLFKIGFCIRRIEAILNECSTYYKKHPNKYSSFKECLRSCICDQPALIDYVEGVSVFTPEEQTTYAFLKNLGNIKTINGNREKEYKSSLYAALKGFIRVIDAEQLKVMPAQLPTPTSVTDSSWCLLQ